jgi:hypothetical protein
MNLRLLTKKVVGHPLITGDNCFLFYLQFFMLQDPQNRTLLLSLSCVKEIIMGRTLARRTLKYLWVLGGKYRKAFSTARRHSAALLHHHLFTILDKETTTFKTAFVHQ